MNKQQTTSTKQLQEGVRDEIERREWNYKTREVLRTRVLLTALIHVLRTDDSRKNIYFIRSCIYILRVGLGE